MSRIKFITRAEGVTGFLMFNAGTNESFFRVYRSASDFTDYAIHHHDLEITIAKDAGAAFYLNEISGEEFLDYNPAALGRKEGK